MPSDNDNVLRIVTNIQLMIETAEFKGADSRAVAEALAWINHFREKLSEQSTGKETADSSGNGEGSGRLFGSEIPHS